MQKFINILNAETTKLKYRPLYWLCLLVPIIISIIVFTVHFIDINNATGIGDNPWDKLWRAGNSIFSVFLAIPFIIFLIATALHLEHKSNIWKCLYTTPVERSTIIITKVTVLLLTNIVVIGLLFVFLIISGYTLNTFLPEMEFGYYSPISFTFFKSLGHTFLALLGVLGIQYYLSFKFKGFLVPIAVGILGFILGLILGTINNPIAHYFPYSYPTIVQEDGMFQFDNVGISHFGIINSVEVASILCFLVFVTLTLWNQNNKQLK